MTRRPTSPIWTPSLPPSPLQTTSLIMSSFSLPPSPPFPHSPAHARLLPSAYPQIHRPTNQVPSSSVPLLSFVVVPLLVNPPSPSPPLSQPHVTFLLSRALLRLFPTPLLPSHQGSLAFRQRISLPLVQSRSSALAQGQRVAPSRAVPRLLLPDPLTPPNPFTVPPLLAQVLV